MDGYAEYSEFGLPLKYYVSRSLGGVLKEVYAIDPGQLGRTSVGTDDSYKWILSANEEPHREERRHISGQTLRAIECLGYVIGQQTALLQHVDVTVNETRLISPSCGEWPDSASLPSAQHVSTSLRFVKGVVLEVAMQRCNEGRRVVAVNAASAYHSGGGFSTGGRHALEEAMCIQSTLYPSLKRGEALAQAAGVQPPCFVPARRDGKAWCSHLPADGALLSPKIEVFRGGSLEGYPFEARPTQLEGIVSIAMPNRNASMSDSPVDAPSDEIEYREALKARWRAALVATVAYTKADCLVVPDAGCGVFKNQPEAVGTALGEVLRALDGCVQEVIIASPAPSGERFAAAAQAAHVGEEIPLPSALPRTEIRWSFETGQGPQAFYDDCQAAIESAYQVFCSGGVHSIWIASGGKRINIDLKNMTQLLEGSTRKRRIMRQGPQGQTRTVASQESFCSASTWSFETGHGFQHFDDECQKELEIAHEAFAAGGPSQLWTGSGGKRIGIDFQRMTQRLEGSERERRIQRGTAR